jgi:hypothetical protein
MRCALRKTGRGASLSIGNGTIALAIRRARGGPSGTGTAGGAGTCGWPAGLAAGTAPSERVLRTAADGCGKPWGTADGLVSSATRRAAGVTSGAGRSTGGDTGATDLSTDDSRRLASVWTAGVGAVAAGIGRVSTTGASTGLVSAAGRSSGSLAGGVTGFTGGKPSKLGSTRKGARLCPQASPARLAATVPAKPQQRTRVSGLRR